MTLRIQQLIDLWGEPQGAVVNPDQPVGTVCTDSRRLGAGDFFVPLVGERFDGHHFLEQLPALGGQGAVVSLGRERSSGLGRRNVAHGLLEFSVCAQGL